MSPARAARPSARRAPLRLAVLGDPLAFTLSPVLHRAGLAALGIAGDSVARRTPLAELGEAFVALRSQGYHGANLTHPLKEAALDHLASASPEARRARSVNAVRFAKAGTTGHTTDGNGFVDWLATLGRAPASERVLLLGAGGAARSLALALNEAGARLASAARDPERARAAWGALPVPAPVAWEGEEFQTALDQATLVVNATPVSAARAPLDPARAPRAALLVDLVYGPELSAWARAARALGREAHDGLGMLIGQARLSFEFWCGAMPSFEALANATGWPR